MFHIEPWIESIANTLAGNGLLALIIVICLLLVIKGADWLVEGAVELASDLGMPKLIIGATIVSLGTTTPEAAVSVLAALQGKPGLAIGNGIGSLICDLALILGLAMVLTPIPIREKMVKRQSRIVLAAALFFCVLAYAFPQQVIERWMGFVLVAGLVLYLYSSLAWARKNRQDLAESPVHVPEAIPQRRVSLSVLMLLCGLLVLLAASHVLIPAVGQVATRLHIPDAIIAATLVALGTSLPELMTALTSVRKGHPELVLGNVLGADALNILFVIGVSASAMPLALEREFTHFQGPFMIALLVMFQLMVIFTRGHFRRWQGWVLLASYALFILISVLVLPRIWPVA